MKRVLLGLMTVGDESCQQMRQEVVGAAMACVLDLADILDPHSAVC